MLFSIHSSLSLCLLSFFLPVYLFLLAVKPTGFCYSVHELVTLLLSNLKSILLSAAVSCHFSVVTLLHPVHLQSITSSPQVELIRDDFSSHTDTQPLSSSPQYHCKPPHLGCFISYNTE